MKLENAELGYTCSVPDRPTVRQQLEFFAVVGDARGKERFERYWEGAKAVITDWQCPALPDIQANIDDLTNPIQARIILSVGLRVVTHMNSLEDLPPNS